MKPFKVFGKEVPISFKKDLEHSGEFDREAYTIDINKGLNKEEKRLTLLHELVHATMKRSGVNQAIPGELEEVICEVISQVIDENFHLRRK